MNSLKEIYAYREMIFSLVRKDLRTRYKGSVLGFLWTFVNPLLQLIVNSVVFSVIMRVQMDKYYLYMFVGLLPWIFFCNCLQHAEHGSVASMMHSGAGRVLGFTVCGRKAYAFRIKAEGAS